MRTKIHIDRVYSFLDSVMNYLINDSKNRNNFNITKRVSRK